MHGFGAGIISLGDTGLKLKIGPELVFKASGEIGAFFTWKPTIDVGFSHAAPGRSTPTPSRTSSRTSA